MNNRFKLNATADKPTILVVDDTIDNIHFMGESLGAEYSVLFATNGEEALNIAQSYQRPDLILLDVVMPGMDGYEVCSRLKESPATASIPVIFVTVKDDVQNETKGLELGAVDYITKPFSLAIVKARIHTHLELKRKTDILAELSMLDGLTGISNRRRFDEFLAQEWLRCQRLQTPISLVMIDIDFFKSYNDYYGHCEGDECIRSVANQLLSCLRRPTDLVARYGGEEFCAILPETNEQGAERLAEDMRASVESLALPHQRSDAAPVVSVSVGVASCTPSVDMTIKQLLERADEALYTAKHNGRNQITCLSHSAV